MNEAILTEVLNQLREVTNKVENLQSNQAVFKEQIVHIADALEKNTLAAEKFSEFMNHGKAVGKVVAVVVASLASISAAWDWIVAHVRF